MKDDHAGEHLCSIFEGSSAGSQSTFFEEVKHFAIQHPENAFAQKIFGNVLFYQGRLLEAESHYRSALEMDPDNIDLLYDLSIVLYYQARLTETQSQLQKLLKAAPEYSPAHYRLGLTYYHLGQYDKAIEHLNKCAVLSPDFEMAHFHLGIVWAKMGKLELAIEQFHHQLDRNLKDAASRNYLEELFVKKWKSEVVKSADSQ
ncbi:MAG: tetratricopeptide repeat protein [bacterium]